jgi:hypothetical protein
MIHSHNLSDEPQVVRFRNGKTGKKYLAAPAPNSKDEFIWAECDANDESIRAGNRISREEYNKILDDEDM